ncbi:MAG: threonylcarbamoyl-AMP synthase [Neomegalonema sp.]|nr:threonylcarbamoyl-AMP synthase [Neomegalonema sp.]
MDRNDSSAAHAPQRDAATQVLTANAREIERAAELLRSGHLVALPTETVYGLGADARQGSAVAAIFAAKNRPRFNPLICHVADLAAAERIAVFDAQAQALAEAFWPGPLTLVLPRRAGCGLSDLVSAGLETVALRVPAHPLAQSLLAAFDGPIAAPSANLSGTVSPTSAAHVLDGLRGRIAAVLDGGACPVGVESTIIGWEEGRARLLRPGGVSLEQVQEILGQPIERGTEGGAISAPGQLRSHYAPRAALRLNAQVPEESEAWLDFGASHAHDGPSIDLSPRGDLHEAAAALFGALRALDGERARIAVAPIPLEGLGLAINDRLSRAAAPRPDDKRPEALSPDDKGEAP